MKIEYKFVTGEKVNIEVYGEFEEIMFELNNELKNHDRKETRKHKSLDLFDKDLQSADLKADIYSKFLKNLDKDKLYAAIEKLKLPEQELLHNLCLKSNPMTQATYAKVLGITENAVQLRLTKIKKKLKAMF